jgi:branched-chain amino acid transport system substrate-binding protein
MYARPRPWRLAKAAIGAIGAVALLGTAACGGSDGAAASGDSDKPIVIGHAGAKTGFMSTFDGPIGQGMALAVEEVNAKGGVLGRKLEIREVDSASDLSKSRKAGQQLLDGGADFIVPTCDYNLGGPAAQAAGEKGKVAIGCAGGALFGRQGLGPLTFNVFQGSATEGAVSAEYAVQRGWKRAFMITDTSLAYTKDICKNFKARFTAIGGSLTGEETMQGSDTSVSSQIAKLRNTDSDVVMLCSLPPQGVTALRQLRSSGYSGPILGTDTFDGTFWTESVPGVSDFFVPTTGAIAGDDPEEARKDFFTRFQKATGKPPVSAMYPMSGYAAVETLVAGIEDAGSIEGEKVAKAIETFKDRPLLMGPTTYTAECHVPVGRALLMTEYRDGEQRYLETVTPKDVPDKTC